MAVGRLICQVKRPYGLGAKVALVVILGLCFIVFWSFFSTSSTSISSQRSTFGEILTPISVGEKNKDFKSFVGPKDHLKSTHRGKKGKENGVNENAEGKTKEGDGEKETEVAIDRQKQYNEEKQGESPIKYTNQTESVNGKGLKDNNEGEDNVEEGANEGIEIDGVTAGDDVDQEPPEEVEDENGNLKRKGKKKTMGPLFDSKAHYNWKLCIVRSKHNYIPCIDIERAVGKLHSYRYTERSCPRTPPLCLVPLPEGYASPVSWPESTLKILYRNVAHQGLAAYIKKHSWLALSGDYLTFPQNQSLFKGGSHHYVDSVGEMVPDIEWGKNIRLVLDIGCTDASFGAALSDMDVLTLCYGIKDDLADLAQVTLERGFPAVVGSMAARRLPFPSGVFDAIHCGECNIHWHSNSGKLLLEINRILRPGGYFVLSTERENVVVEEAMSKLTASFCWNILAHRTDETSEVSVKIYQKPSSNDIYQLRRKKNPPLCKEDENPDSVWHVPITTCLHTVPAAVEERGTEWPEEWPKRLESFPDWLNEKDKVSADTNHWKAVVSKSYLNGLGIDWPNVRKIMDMKSIYGGFAAALASQNVWVMNVVPVHAPNTLPIIYERGLIGVYHDWCESFSSYPRSYDLLHADHLFSRLKNRCKKTVGIVVEMDRLLRPGGWAIIRDKVEILASLEVILKSLRWEIHMTYAKDKEGIICAQKKMWRP